ncbi:hypothetical protein FRB94_012010 [Tulasnella sp. JGI-2019a]|nr:hypothetical protein FRB94_012010 [Tulasnella sp. JGI-2019a]
MVRPALIALLTAFARSTFAVTVYTSATAVASTSTAVPTYTNPSVDRTMLQAPAAPQDQNPTVTVQLLDGGLDGLSNPVSGTLMGWSIELSIADTLIGATDKLLRPEFLNYCVVIAARAGGVTIRVGGNTQDKAKLMDSLPNNKTIIKTVDTESTAKTRTPIVEFTLDLFGAMQSVGKLVKVGWFFGIPFVNTNLDGNAGLIVQKSKEYLGDSLLGLQLANEPDLYSRNSKKSETYGIQDFFTDTQTMIQNLPITEPLIIGPSICCAWDFNEVMSDGYLTQFKSAIKFIDMLHYPNNNCQPGAVIPQEILSYYLSHTNVQNFVNPYIGVAQLALEAGKQFMMMETNTASCGGFAGVSNSFGAALWGVDYGLQMGYANFTYALFHFGGQSTYYNPFTPPPTNMTRHFKWTTGPIFYSFVVVAEALGKSGNARVVDLRLDDNNPHRAGYAVYENNAAARVVLVNYVTAPGTGDYTANIAIGGQQTGMPNLTPATVRVKYLLAGSKSVTERDDITWAGQTMGGVNAADGRLTGTPDVQTIQCDAATGICAIPVPAPSIALVFLTDAAYENSGGEHGDASVTTFPVSTTTVHAGKGLAALPTMDKQTPLLGTSKGNYNIPSGSGRSAAAGVGSWSVVLLTGWFMMRWMI